MKVRQNSGLCLRLQNGAAVREGGRSSLVLTVKSRLLTSYESRFRRTYKHLLCFLGKGRLGLS